MQRIDQQEHKAADHHADNGAEVGDQIRHRHNNRHQADIIHPADDHEEGIHEADNQRIQKGLAKVVHQDHMAAKRKVHDLLGFARRKNAAQEAPEPAHHPLFVDEKIDRKDRSDHGGNDPLAGVCRRAQDSAGVLTHKIGNAAQGILGKCCKPFRIDEALQRTVLEHFDHGGGIAVDVLRKRRNTLYQLRNQRAEQEKQQQQAGQHSQSHGKAPACLPRFHLFQDLEIKEARHRVQDIGKNDAQKDSPEIPQKAADRREHRAEVCQQHIEKNADTGGDRPGIPGLFFKLFQFHQIILLPLNPPYGFQFGYYNSY